MVVKDSWTGLEDGITDATWGVCLPKNVLEHHPTVMLDSGRGKRRLERSKAKVLEGRLQENKDVGGFHDDS